LPGSKGSSVGKRPIAFICRAVLVILIIILGLGSLSLRDVTYPEARGGESPLACAVVLVVIDSLSIEDINHKTMPNLTKLTETGAIGLMNGRTAKTQQPEHAYVTIGAGTRAEGPVEAGYAVNSLEPFEGAKGFEVYMRNTNEPPPSAESVVHPYIAAIIRANADLSYEIVPGALGEAVHRAGKRTAVFGNSDTLGSPCRYAASIAMDRRGLVDMGNVGQATTLEKSDLPGGIVSDVPRISWEVKDAMGCADLIVVESGDTARVERMWLSGAITTDAYFRARQEALSSADTLIAGILESVSLRDTVLMVVVPTPGQDASRAGHLLTPMVIAGKGFSGGILTSQATRRRGLVTNTDVAATVLQSLGVTKPPWILGSGMTSVPDPKPIQSITKLLQRTAHISGLRAPHLKTYVSLLIIVALGLPILIVVRTSADNGRKMAPGARAVAGGKAGPVEPVAPGGKAGPEGKIAPGEPIVPGGKITSGRKAVPGMKTAAEVERRAGGQVDGKRGLIRWRSKGIAISVLLALGAMPLVWLVMPVLTFAVQPAMAGPSFAPFPVGLSLFLEPDSFTEFTSSAARMLSQMSLSGAVTATPAVPTTDTFSLIPPGLLTIGLAIAISLLLKAGFETLEGRFTAMCLATGLGIIVDALAGAGLMKHSVLGYDPIGGARFYGIGNEYMGALVGSLIVGCGLLLDCIGAYAQTQAKRRSFSWLVFFAFTSGIIVLAMPGIGANLGGTCAAIAGFGVAYVLFLRKSVTWYHIASSVGLGILLIIAIASIDARLASGPLSHWGKTLLWARESGIQVLVDVVRRKASMNLKLIRYTIWTRAFLVFVGALAFIRIRPVGLAQKILAGRPCFTAGLSACLVAGGVSLITNDSGIVSAALITMYPALVLLGLAWQEVM
jgi:hypothetical protein